MNQCYVCFKYQNTILIRSAEGKYFFCILHMLWIHTGLPNLSNTNVYDLDLKEINPFDIGKPFIKSTMSELLFEQYR